MRLMNNSYIVRWVYILFYLRSSFQFLRLFEVQIFYQSKVSYLLFQFPRHRVETLSTSTFSFYRQNFAPVLT